MCLVVSLLVGGGSPCTSVAQTVVTRTSRLHWTQAGTSLTQVQAFRYNAYINTNGLSVLQGVICTGALSPFDCTSILPSLAVGVHTIELTAVDLAESMRSTSFSVQVLAAPAPPSSVGIVGEVTPPDPPDPPSGDPTPTFYIDNALLSDCLTAYDSTQRICGTGTAKAYFVFKTGIEVAAAGDVIDIRGGTPYSITSGVNLTNAGTPTQRITIMGHVGEPVLLKGLHDVDTDGDGTRDWDEDENPVDGEADGFTDDRTMLGIFVDYVTIKRLSLAWGYRGLRIEDGASHILVEEVKCSDTWLVCFTSEDGGDDNVYRYNAASYLRHSTPFGVGVGLASQEALRSVFYRNFSFNNGRQRPIAAEVLVAGGDPAGGGNSDGIAGNKNCSDLVSHAGPDGTQGLGICREIVIQENILWRNTDDCFDLSYAASYVIGNIGVDCGPNGLRGLKMLRPQFGMTFSGNLILAANPASDISTYRGYELRLLDSPESGTSTLFAHNLSARAFDRGVYVAQAATGSLCPIRNNVVWGSLGVADYAFGVCANSHNYTGGVSGTLPTLEDPTVDPTAVFDTAEACLVDAPHLRTIQSCWEQAYAPIAAAFHPRAGSSLIDAGVVIAGYHCTLADDNGQDVHAACRHWRGLAPDQGPFEFGIPGNPDQTKCVEVDACE